jgi:hypothetical protein
MTTLSQNETVFSIRNLPYGVVSTRDDNIQRCAVAYKDNAVILNEVVHSKAFELVEGLPKDVFEHVMNTLYVRYIIKVMLMSEREASTPLLVYLAKYGSNSEKFCRTIYGHHTKTNHRLSSYHCQRSRTTSLWKPITFPTFIAPTSTART